MSDLPTMLVVPGRSTAMEAADYVLDHLDHLERVAKRMHESRLMPRHLDSPAAVLAVIIAGRELGMGMMEAARSLYLVEGRIVMAADVQLARVLAGGIVAEWVTTTAERAHLRLTRPGRIPYDSIYTIEQARRPGVDRQGNPTAPLASRGTWRQRTEAMLRARAITAGVRAYCPDVLGSQVYDADELEASAVVSTPTKAPAATEPETVAAEVVEPAKPGHHATWAAAGPAWCAQLREATGHTYADVAAWTEARHAGRPSAWEPKARSGLLRALTDVTHAKRIDLDAWVAARAAEHAEDDDAAREPGADG